MPLFGFAQTIQLYDPQLLYDTPGGLYEEDSLRTLYVDFLDPNYHTVLQDAFFNNPSLRIPATVSMNGVVYDSVGVRYKGNSTFCIPNDNGIPKVPYNLDFNYWISGQKIEGYKKIKLANAWLDPTFAKEVTASNVYRKYLPTKEVNLMKLNVEGNYLGLYVNTEAVNRQFLEKHFNERDGALFKCDNAKVFCGPPVPTAFEPSLKWMSVDSADYYDTYTIKSEHGWADLLKLINTLNFTPNKLDSVLNIDRVLWAFAVNTVLANYDTYNGYYVHNYYLYKTKDGLFQMIPWDLSESFVNALYGFDISSGPDPAEYDPYFGSDPIENRPLTAVLFNHPLYRDVYTAHIRTVMNEIDVSGMQGDISDLQSLAFDAANSDSYKMFNMFQYYYNVNNDLAYLPWGGFGFGGIFSILGRRQAYLQSHSEIVQTPPTIGAVDITDGLLTAVVSNADSVHVMATLSNYNSKFKPFVMYNDGTNGDAVAGDSIFTANLPYLGAGQAVKFYIRARNSAALKLSPERAEYEFYYYQQTPDPEPTNVSDVLLIYPNPASTTITIESNGENAMNYSLFATSGKVIETGVINTSTYTIDVSQLASEMYFLRLDEKVYKVMKTR